MTEHLAALAARPRLRGWLHLWAFVVSIVAGLVLVTVAGSTRGAEAALATSVYALTVMLLFGKHNVSAETYARAVRVFGLWDLSDFVVGLMARHASDAGMLTAFDQHLPPGQKPLLPMP